MTSATTTAAPVAFSLSVWRHCAQRHSVDIGRSMILSFVGRQAQAAHQNQLEVYNGIVCRQSISITTTASICGLLLCLSLASHSRLVACLSNGGRVQSRPNPRDRRRLHFSPHRRLPVFVSVCAVSMFARALSGRCLSTVAARSPHHQKSQ